jgi:hypothetical protein
MIKNISIKARLIFVIALLGVELILGAAVGLFSLSHANSGLQSLYANSIVCLGQLDQIVRRLDENQTLLARALTAEGDMARASAVVHGAMNTQFVPVRDSIDELIKVQMAQADEARKESQSTYETCAWSAWPAW